jgi:hypothetical protein
MRPEGGSRRFQMTRKIIIVCLDGTWNDLEFDKTDTNIARLRSLIAHTMRAQEATKHEESSNKHPLRQFRGSSTYHNRPVRLFYERGVGTSGFFDRFAGGGFGIGLDANIRRAYRFLSRNYIHGDDIFIFGFSRGAYTARSLVGYIGAVGLLRPERCLPEIEVRAWNYYRTPREERSPGVWRDLTRDMFDRDRVEIACLGVFDTVGAMGIPLPRFRRENRQRFQFHDLNLAPACKLNLHAMAIDEHRLPFEATLWRDEGASAIDASAEQVWFPGAHADVGGGYFSERRIRAELDDLTLDWLLKRISCVHQDFPAPPSCLAPVDCKTATISDQHEPKYPFLSAALRSIGNTRARSRLWPRAQPVGQNLHAPAINEMVHISAIDRMGLVVAIEGRSTVYGPPNLLAALVLLRKTYERQVGAHPLLIVGHD